MLLERTEGRWGDRRLLTCSSPVLRRSAVGRDDSLSDETDVPAQEQHEEVDYAGKNTLPAFTFTS